MFIYLLDLCHVNGQVEAHSEAFAASVLIAGRADTSDILLRGHSVAPKHARFEAQGEALTVTALTPDAGLWVNGEPVIAQLLHSGDEVRLGGVLLKISQENGRWRLYEQRHLSDQKQMALQVQQFTQSLDIRHSLPGLLALSVLAVLLVLLWTVAWPSWRGDQSMLSSGPLSTSHQLAGKNCATCHGETSIKFAKESPMQRCIQCHALTEHAGPQPDKSGAGAVAAECGGCHLEHEGDAQLVIRDNRLCTGCHQDLRRVAADTTLANVSSFADHPEFRVATGPVAAGQKPRKASLTDRKTTRDPTSISLNHRLHLQKYIRGVTGENTLGCADCHRPTPDLRGFMPVRYQQHCQKCHALELEGQTPISIAPHGDTDATYRFIYAQIASAELAAAQPPDKLPGRANPVGVVRPAAAASAVKALQQSIQTKARQAEDQLINSTGCMLCHGVVPRAAEAGSLQSRFDVEPVHLPNQWFTGTQFSHGRHEQLRCESCHARARESRQTADILLPDIGVCRNCHTPSPDQPGVVACQTCHVYHQSLPLPNQKKIGLEKLLRQAPATGVTAVPGVR